MQFSSVFKQRSKISKMNLSDQNFLWDFTKDESKTSGKENL